MSATITGLGSGFDITSWVSQLVAVRESSTVTPLQEKLTALETKNTALTSLKSKYTTLQSSLQTFTKTIYNSSSDMWSKTATTSSNESYATVSSSGSVAASQVELFIEQIATATQAKSVNSLGSVSKENAENVKFVNLANGQAESGNFSMFLDGEEFKIQIDEDDTLKDVIDKIYKSSDGLIQASVDDNGNFTISAYTKSVTNGSWGQQQVSYEINQNAELILGSAGDDSNLASALKLHTKEGSYTYTSAYPVSTINTSEGMGSAESGLSGVEFTGEDGKGKIIINGAEIEVDGDMSLNQLISKINGNSDTHVKASYDSLTNKLILTSKETGKTNISLSSENTNLLNVLGLTEGTGENEKLAVGSQTLGQNAIVHINGNEVISNSNTITGESSGIANLSITIKKPTSDYSGNEKDEKSVLIDIEPDYSQVKSALEKVVSAYNDVVSTTKTMIASDGKIGRDSSLSSIVSQLRGITSMVSDNDGVYSMLAEIGITSDEDDVSKLKIDSDKLEKALSEDFESVKNLLSDGYTAKEDNGIFDRVLKNINAVLDIDKGYFTTIADSVQSQITSMNSRIERANTRLSNYETRLTKQFNQMDTTIANLNSQLTTFSSYIS